MSRLSFRPTALPLAVVVGALALAACSDGPLSPTRSLASSSADFNVTGTKPLTIASGNATQLCTSQQVNGDYTIPATPYGPFAGCGVALDLTASLNVYNPGWSMPLAGSSWIGFNAKAGPSSDYRANPGRYVYQEVFTVPASVTNPALDMFVKADNVAAVYLNGKLLGSQANTDCNPDVPVCNWNGTGLHITDNTPADFQIGASNTLTFLVIDLPTGAFSAVAGVGGSAPQYGCTTRQPQTNGTAGYSATLVPTVPAHVIAGGGTGVGITGLGTAGQAGCENPTGLDYAGTMNWTVATTTWCSPGFWKNKGVDLWTAYHNVKYSTLVGAAALKKGSPSDPTLLEVVSNPSVYGGPATNSVADFISNKAFGTPIGQGVESCPSPDPKNFPGLVA